MKRAPITCDAARRALRHYLDELVDPETTESIREHLDGCEPCGSLLRAQVDSALQGEAFQPEQRLIGAAVAATRPIAAGSRAIRKRRRISVAAGLIAAGLITAGLVAATFVVRDRPQAAEPSPKERVLTELRRGPLDVTMASYRLEDRSRADDSVGSTGRLVVDGPRLTLHENRPDGELIRAKGFDGTWSWSFNPAEDRLRVARGDGGSGGAGPGDPGADDDPEDPALAPGLLTGPALADYLSTNFELAYAGEQEVDGHRCWILVGSRRSSEENGDTTLLRCYVDAARRVMRKWVKEGPHSTQTAVLIRLGPDGDAPFGPGGYVSPSTRLDLASAAFPLAGVPLEELVAEIQSSFGLVKVGIAVRLDANSFDPPGVRSGSGPGDGLPEEIRSLLAFLGDAQGSRRGPGLFTDARVIFRSEGSGPDLPDLPEGFSKKITPEALREASSLAAILDVLSTETGVKIEVRGTQPIAASFTFRAPIPIPAAMVLRSAADAHGLTVRVEEGHVVLEPAGQ